LLLPADINIHIEIHLWLRECRSDGPIGVIRDWAAEAMDPVQLFKIFPDSIVYLEKGFYGSINNESQKSSANHP
jgi:hypothetical protein